jgi:hypothetical protein
MPKTDLSHPSLQELFRLLAHDLVREHERGFGKLPRQPEPWTADLFTHNFGCQERRHLPREGRQKQAGWREPVARVRAATKAT